MKCSPEGKVKGKVYSLPYVSLGMKLRLILLALLVALCIGQEKPVEKVQEQTQEVTAEPEEDQQLTDSAVQTLVESYFAALNQRDLSTLTSLTHPYYVEELLPFLEFVSQNDISFTIKSVSRLMDENEFRELEKGLSDEEFTQQIGKRGLSYEVVLAVTKGGTTYEDFTIFVEVGETEQGWKVLRPYVLQVLIETELEVRDSEK